MTKARNLMFATILAGFSLTGCTYFDAPPPTGDDAMVDAMNKDLQYGPATEGDRSFARPIYPHEYSVMQSNSSVEVYSLEDEMPQQDGAAYADDRNSSERVQLRTPSAGAGMTMGDPSVEIFPLEGSSSARSYGQPARAEIPEQQEISDAEALNRAMFYFAHNSAGVKAEDMDKLYELAEVYRAQSVSGFSVEGHASERSSLPDPVERQTANLKMSMMRAYEVAKILMQNGVDGDDIVLKAYGAANSNGEDTSRRVDVRPLYN